MTWPGPGVRRPRRWPLHPPPTELESLSSWTSRLAAAYGMSVKDLLGGHNLDLGDAVVPVDLDVDPPQVLLDALAERTGVEPARVRAMTFAGWTPWLFDQPSYPGSRGQEVFETYVRANSVLLMHGEAGINKVSHPARWSGPWHPLHWSRRACPVCASDPGRGKALTWRLALMLGCGEHGCYLEDEQRVALGVLTGQPVPARPVPEPVATTERYTHAALTTGHVELPGRTVHAGVWFRLLRSLLDEVSVAPATRRAHGRKTLEQVWAATGLPERGGLNIWRPYEHLAGEQMEAMHLAAATALRLAADGTITAYGRLASAIQAPREQYVYPGDRPDPYRNAWQEAAAQAEAAMITARTDPEVARQLLAWLTIGCRRLAEIEQQRSYLFGAGVPAEFLPSAADLGRSELT